MMAYFNTQSILKSKSHELNAGGQRQLSAQGLLGQIAEALVDRPDQVNVTMLNANQTVIIELNVAKEDLGKVIGRQGRTAQALRTLLSAVSAKEGKRIVLEIIE
jgi:hypothetical protein